MLRDQSRIFGISADVTTELVVVAKIDGVGLPRLGIPPRGKNAVASDFLKTNAQSADPGEEIDEAE